MKKEELQRAISEKAKTINTGIIGKSEFAALIMEIVQPNHLSLDLFSAFLPVRQMNPGDLIGRRVQRGRYPVRTLVPGQKFLTDVTSYLESQYFQFDRLTAGTHASLWEIQNGEVPTVEQMRTEIRADIFDALVSKVFTLLATVWNSTDTPSNYIDASSTGITSTALDTAIERAIEVSGGARAIIGSRAALLPVYSFAQYREFVLGGTGNNPDRALFPIATAFDEFTRTGRVSTYKGVPIVEVPQVYRNRLPANATGTLRSVEQRMIPTDRVTVVGNDPGTIYLMGETQYQDMTDVTTIPPNYVVQAYQAYGMVIDDVEGITVIKTNT